LYPGAETVRAGVVVNEAFAVAGKILKIPPQFFAERKAPVYLGRASVFGRPQVVSKQETECVVAPFVGPGQLAVTQIAEDVRVVVAFFIFRDTIPFFP